MAASFEWLDEAEVGPSRPVRRGLPRLHRGRLLKLGGLTTAALLVASLTGHASRTKPEADDGSELINAGTTVYLDSGPVYDGAHELVEMNCLFRPTLGGVQPEVGNIKLHGYTLEGYVPAAKPFAVQLAHPDVDNFAIVYTGLTEIDELQHINFKATGDTVHIEADTPEIPGYGASSNLLSKNIRLGNGYVTEDHSGLVRYAVGEWSGKFTVALACDTKGAQMVVMDELRQAGPSFPILGDSVAPGLVPGN